MTSWVRRFFGCCSSAPLGTLDIRIRSLPITVSPLDLCAVHSLRFGAAARRHQHRQMARDGFLTFPPGVNRSPPAGFLFSFSLCVTIYSLISKRALELNV